MAEFKGFPEGKIHQTPVPAPFFRELLPAINHLGELKVSIYVFWRLGKMEGAFRFLRETDFIEDESFMLGLGGSPEIARAELQESLQLAVRRGTLLQAEVPIDEVSQAGVERLYFLNSPKGRAALRAIESGKWRPGRPSQAPPLEVGEPPNIFRLYEENIGALTPMIAEALTDAEQTYPVEWIEDAIRVAVQNNKRNWRYALAILERWQQEGKRGTGSSHGRKEKSKDRPDSEEARRRYVEGEFSDFVEH